MSDSHVRSFSDPDDVLEAGRVRSEILSLMGITVGRDVHLPGWRWSEDVRPSVGTSLCEVRHIGIAMRGEMHVVLEDEGEFDIHPGDVYHIPPRHDAWVEGDEPFECVEWIGAGSWISPLGALARRVLATLVLTDIDDSTGTARRLGDRAWGELVEVHEARVRDTVIHYGGREIKQTGDGVLATFDGAARALRCAIALRALAGGMGLSVRAAVHTGEVELSEGDVRGLAVHETARMLATAGPSEILASATTKDLSGDPGLLFEDRGVHRLRGIEGTRHLYRVELVPAQDYSDREGIPKLKGDLP